MLATRNVLLVAMFMVITAGCASINNSDTNSSVTSEPSNDKLTNAVERSRSPQFGYPRNRTPASFYVALEAMPKWSPNSRTDCVDESFWAWIRKLGKADTAESSLIVTVTMLSGQRVADSIVDRKLTQAIRADVVTGFKLQSEIVCNKSTDFKVAERLIDATSALLVFAGGSGWMIEKLAAPQLRAAGQKLDETISDHWSERCSDKYESAIQVYPGTHDEWETHTDARMFNIGRVVGSSGGVSLENSRIPTTTTQLVYIDSLFANNGMYPDPATVLNTPLGPSNDPQNPVTLSRLIMGGVRNASKDNLRDVESKRQMESYCTDIKDVLGESFTSRDALVARFSAVKLYSPYGTVQPVRSEKCFDTNELMELAALGPHYRFIPLERTDFDSRDQAVQERMEPVREAIRGGMHSKLGMSSAPQ